MTKDYFFWSLVFALVAVAVIFWGALRAGSHADDEMMGDSQYEEHIPQMFECVRCGGMALPHQLRSIAGETKRVLVHAGGCPRDRKRPRRSPQE